MNWLDLFAVQGTQESSPSEVVYSYGSHAFFKEVRVSPLRWGRGRVGKHYLEFSVLIFSLPINKSWVFSIVTCLFCLHMLLMGCLLLLFSHSRVWLFATSWTLQLSFPVSQQFTSDGQNIGSSTLASTLVLSVNIHCWLTSRLTGLIYLLFKGLSRLFSNTTDQKHQFFGAQLSSQPNSHIHTWLLKKPYFD